MFKQLDKKIVFLFLGRFVQGILSIFAVRLMTELLDQKEVGNQYLINSMILWFSLVLINPVGMFVNRHLHEWKVNKQIYFYIKELNKYFLMIALISLPVVAIVRNVFNIGLFLPNAEILAFIALYIFFSTWFQTLISFFNLLDFQKLFVFLNILAQSLGLICSVAATWMFGAHALSWLSGLLLGQAVTLVVAMVLFRQKLPPAQSNEVPEADFFQKSTLTFCLPIAVTTFFMWFSTQGYRLLVEKNMGVEVLASIGVGLGLAASLAAVVEAITTQYFFPRYYASLPGSTLEGRTLAWQELWQKTISVYVPFAFLTCSVADLMVVVLTAKGFHHVVNLVFFGAAIELFRQLSNIAYLVSHAEKKTINTVLPYGLGAVFLIAALGFVSSIEQLMAALVIVSIIIYVANIFVVKRLIGFKFRFRELAKAVGLSLPLLIPLFFVSVETPVVVLFLIGGVCGLWCLGSVVWLVKKT